MRAMGTVLHREAEKGPRNARESGLNRSRVSKVGGRI